VGSAIAAPQSVRQPALRPVDDQGLLDAVASKSTKLMSTVRDGSSNLLDSAMNFLGVRYKLGGNTAETGFDCSGFTRYVFENSLGRVLPHRADEQANAPELAKVDRKDLKPGDLVFFDTMRRTFSHVGIYLGDGKFIHSPRTGQSIRVESINVAYWARRFTGARRAPELAVAGSDAPETRLAALATRTPANGAVAAALAVNALGGASAAPAETPAFEPAGVQLTSAPPALPERSAVGFAPRYEPFAGPLVDR